MARFGERWRMAGDRMVPALRMTSCVAAMCRLLARRMPVALLSEKVIRSTERLREDGEIR